MKKIAVSLIALLCVAGALLGQHTGGGGGGGGGGLPAGLTFAAPTLTVSTAGSGNGQLALSGNTSGTCTLTDNATSTIITHSCSDSVPTLALTTGSQELSLASSGAANIPNISNTTTSGNGLAVNNSTVAIMNASVVDFAIPLTGGSLCGGVNSSCNMMPGTLSFGFTSGNVISTNVDTSISRTAAGVMAVGTGAQGSTAGQLKAAGYMAVGTTFTSSGGCTEGTLVGGATAGKFTTSGSTSCTTVVTMGNSATAPNGWDCHAIDLTTIADVTNPHQTASTTTTATFATGTIVANDVIQFSCIGY
jgi:hypothetical protein